MAPLLKPLIVAFSLLLPALAGGAEQDRFRTLVRDSGAEAGYSGIAPVQPLGIAIWGAGDVLPTSVNHRIVGRRAAGLPLLVLPFIEQRSDAARRIDLGGSALEPEPEAHLYRVSMRYALTRPPAGSPPHLALRMTACNIEGEDVVDLASRGLELVFTRQSGSLTPYGGVGQVWITGHAEGGLDSERVALPKQYAGVSWRQEQRRFALELDQTGGRKMVGLHYTLDF